MRGRAIAAVGVLAAIVMAGVGLSACTPPNQKPGDYDGSLVSGGITRTYRIHVPTGFKTSKATPLVLALNGGGGTASGMATLTHLNTVADEHGFLVAYPQGYDNGWAAGVGTSPSDHAGIDDVAFLEALITKLSKDYSVDASRVFMTGISNGAFMSHRFACESGGVVAAIMPVAGQLPIPNTTHCTPPRATSVLEVHGTTDPIVPYAGGTFTGRDGTGQVIAATASSADWAALDGCGATPTASSLPQLPVDTTSVNISTYTGCRGGSSVKLYSVVGGGHTWPGGTQYASVSLVGVASQQFDASELGWTFFAAHPKATA